ncbi:LPXTG cell wall anchor domain-containing protein [Glycomyces harbinensis]|uniref:LPXTG-motif cell wall anchor domain-containing protein n=1 Tax=Glycomyces harbinensis TaxID=58114 RepID=A0A1G6T206_9ACTN|nr:LPXTG cell wall anchor domain-containing protein [Glycomyces harbinensis]SDD22517.1 LPXTG-motif cell wall anchor domain-containing protein [Glycomyces harbinensis]
MKFLLLPAVAAAAVVLSSAPASAQEIPSGPVLIHLKDFPQFPLAWDEDRGAHLGEEGSLWVLEPVAEEALTPLGEYRLVHHESGECLDAGGLSDGVHARLDLVDCADAEPWSVVYDTVPANADYRFATPEGYLMGLEHDEAGEEAASETGAPAREEHSGVPTGGAEVFALDVSESRHSHEWLFAAGPDVPPSSPPSETPSDSASPSEAPSQESPAPAPQLPQTGAAVGAAVGAGAIALAGGTALVLWRQRRRALRGHW